MQKGPMQNDNHRLKCFTIPQTTVQCICTIRITWLTFCSSIRKQISWLNVGHITKLFFGRNNKKNNRWHGTCQTQSIPLAHNRFTKFPIHVKSISTVGQIRGILFEGDLHRRWYKTHYRICTYSRHSSKRFYSTLFLSIWNRKLKWTLLLSNPLILIRFFLDYTGNWCACTCWKW